MGTDPEVSFDFELATNKVETSTDPWLKAYTVLGAGFFVETLTLGKALLTAAETAATKKITLIEHIKSGSDPHTNVVLLEDLVAVGGCAVAGGCMYMTVLTGNPVWDASGTSFLIFCSVHVWLIPYDSYVWLFEQIMSLVRLNCDWSGTC